MTEINNYFFVDESGDPTFFNKRGKLIIDNDSCSPILILGFINTNNPRIRLVPIDNFIES